MCIDCQREPEHGDMFVSQYVTRLNGKRFEFEVCGRCLRKWHRERGVK